MSTIKTQESESAIKVRIGPRMRELRDVVSAMPGCSRADALRAAGLPTSGLGSGRPLDRRNAPNRDNGLFSGVLTGAVSTSRSIRNPAAKISSQVLSSGASQYRTVQPLLHVSWMVRTSK